MAVKFRKYERGDWAKVRIRSGDVTGTFSENSVLQGLATVAEEDGRVVACAGVFPLYAGVGQIWAYVSDDARGRGLAMIKHMRDRIPLMMSVMQLHRVQAHVQTHIEEYGRFIKLLGFEYEGTMRCVTPDMRDTDMYAIVRCENG